MVNVVKTDKFMRPIGIIFKGYGRGEDADHACRVGIIFKGENLVALWGPCGGHVGGGGHLLRSTPKLFKHRHIAPSGPVKYSL